MSHYREMHCSWRTSLAWRHARRVVAVLALGAAVPLVGRAAQDQQIFKAGAELVVLHVNVFDKNSDAVPGLPQKAFLVFEDGQVQDISFFSAGDVPVTVGLIIDNSTSMSAERNMVAAGTSAFAESSHPEDELFAIVFNEHVRFALPEAIGFTKNRLQLRTAVQQYRPGGQTALYDAIVAGLGQLENAGYQKRVLVVLSDGGDNASRHSEKEMFDRVLKSNALIYTVVDPNVVVPGDSNPGLLRRLARQSGGLAYFPSHDRDLIGAFREIAANIRRGYSIGYVPSTGHRHEEPHRVKVMVRVPGRSDLSVRVRDGYSEQALDAR